MVCERNGQGLTVTPAATERKAHTYEWKFYMAPLRFEKPDSASVRRAEQRDCLTFVTPIDSEVGFVNGDNGVMGIHLTHANHAKIREIGLAVTVVFREFRQLCKVPIAVERNPQHFVL
jgi:hypothetical protein